MKKITWFNKLNKSNLVIISAVFLCVIGLICFISFKSKSNKINDIFLNFDYKDYNESTSSVQNKKLSITKDTIELEFVLDSSETFYEASFPLTNTRGNDIKLKSIDIKGLPRDMDFTVVYDGKMYEKFPCNVKKILEKDDTVNVTLRAKNKNEDVQNAEKTISVIIKFNFIAK